MTPSFNAANPSPPHRDESEDVPTLKPRIYLETINPFDLTPGDLEEIAVAIETASDVDVGLAYEDQHGAGITWYEVLYIFLPSAEFIKEKAWDPIFEAVIAKMRERFRLPGCERRPKSITVVDQRTGELVEGWVIPTEQAAPQREPTTDVPQRRPLPPPKRRGRQ